MAKLTTSRVGGPARFYVIAASANQLAEDVSFLWERQVPFFLLGSGANILVSDNGLDMLVLHKQARKITIEGQGNSPSVIAESGAILASVARAAAEDVAGRCADERARRRTARALHGVLLLRGRVAGGKRDDAEKGESAEFFHGCFSCMKARC